MYCPRCNARYDYEEEKCGLCGTLLLTDDVTPEDTKPVTIPNWLPLSIAVTILCTWPFGLVAIFFAFQANNLFSKGDFQTARKRAGLARIFIILSVVSFFVVAALFLLTILVTGEMPDLNSL